MGNSENPMVSIDEEGNVLKCAKGLGMGECGYKAGAKVCGKCGATVMKMKMVPAVDGEDDMDAEDEFEDMSDLEQDREEYMRSRKKAAGMMKPGMMKPEMMDEEDDEEEEETPEQDMAEDMAEGETPESDMAEDMSEEDEEEDMDEDEKMMGMGASEEDMEKLRKMRKRRLVSMGMKSAEVGNTSFLCAAERKVYPGSSDVCGDCRGGCVSEKGMPGILEAEGVAEEHFDATVVDSGYNSGDDLFLVRMELKTGALIDVTVHGTTAEVLGYEPVRGKADVASTDTAEDADIIGFLDAADIAVKAIDGEVLAVEPDLFDGIDSYAVEIEGFDGKSYDVFVGLDGTVLGYDAYEPEVTPEEIEAEAAEISLKRAFSEERRMELAEEGMALPDGSYPIVSETDLRNAIQAYGRAKDKEAAKKHIMKRAKEMGKEDLIPEEWMSAEKQTEEPLDVKQEAEFLSALAEFQMLEAEIDNI